MSSTKAKIIERGDLYMRMGIGAQSMCGGRRCRVLPLILVPLALMTGGVYLAGCDAARGAQSVRSEVDWPNYGNNSRGQRFVPLTQINGGNVRRLGLEWSLDLAGENALEATPLEAGR